MKRIISIILVLSFALGISFGVVSCAPSVIQGQSGEKGEKGDPGENGANGLTPFIGENGNWWIGDTDTGVKAKAEDGKDGVDGIDGKDGKDGLTPTIEISDDGYWVINGKKTGYKAVSDNTGAQASSLDDIAYEGLSYRDIFIKSNEAYTDGFNAKGMGAFKKSSGECQIGGEKFYSSPYSLKSFGTTSQQIVSVNGLKSTGEYFVACKVNCTRYDKGELGIHINNVTVGISRRSYDFLTAADVISAKAGQNIYIGSVKSADLDGYVDDPVVVNLSIFKKKPSLDELIRLYEEYVRLERAIPRDEVLFGESEMYEAFLEYMEQKAQEIGMQDSTFVDAVGSENQGSAYDIAKLMVYAYGYEKLDGIWGDTEQTIKIYGKKEITRKINTHVAVPALTDRYQVVGGKTGTLDVARNLAVIIKIPDSDDLLVVVALCALGKNSEENNRYDAVCQIAEAAIKKYRDPRVDNSNAEVCADSAIACVISSKGGNYNQLDVLYAKNEHKKQYLASITKVLTVVCALDYFKDLNENITYSQFDINNCFWYYNDFFAGDMISFKDALYTIFLPSSNTTAITLARITGEKILKG